MRAIDFQDSFSRSQNLDKLHSRELHKPGEDIDFAGLKQAAVEALKKESIQTSEEAKDKLINKDKDADGKEGKKNKGERQKEEESEKPKKRPSSGSSLIDIDA